MYCGACRTTHSPDNWLTQCLVAFLDLATGLPPAPASRRAVGRFAILIRRLYTRGVPIAGVASGCLLTSQPVPNFADLLHRLGGTTLTSLSTYRSCMRRFMGQKHSKTSPWQAVIKSCRRLPRFIRIHPRQSDVVHVCARASVAICAHPILYAFIRLHQKVSQSNSTYPTLSNVVRVYGSPGHEPHALTLSPVIPRCPTLTQIVVHCPPAVVIQQGRTISSTLHLHDRFPNAIHGC